MTLQTTLLETVQDETINAIISTVYKIPMAGPELKQHGTWNRVQREYIPGYSREGEYDDCSIFLFHVIGTQYKIISNKR